ncbi:hypothetical protein OCH239_10050 [Roseivivax halodurans JCM 10272]|uniref:Conjugal transfer protein TrbM n=1 Tax=Roseivivax halodurans JCM 10272 TaxID=1449350 RepID=X7EBR8_9RHOB|nr:hypothetical protein [Roseivivax halodurans]ETX13524.1 hypothetical protein OCH239_10050 [Roseivivax halodurans JCM 10272]
MRVPKLVAVILLVSSLFTTKAARAYDMDCAIMLCMAGGFPSSDVCAEAYAEMIRRITPWPVQPPFGVCSFSGPVPLGGASGERELDISTPDYAWLRRTRVLWWRSRHWGNRTEGTEYWSWSLRSCDHEIRNCRILSRRYSSTTPWPASFVTEHGQVITPPENAGRWFSNRAVRVEYGDYEGKINHSDWVRY